MTSDSIPSDYWPYREPPSEKKTSIKVSRWRLYLALRKIKKAKFLYKRLNPGMGHEVILLARRPADVSGGMIFAGYDFNRWEKVLLENYLRSYFAPKGYRLISVDVKQINEAISLNNPTYILALVAVVS